MRLSDPELAITAAEAGAAVARARFGTPLARFEKAAVGDFATEADIAAERAILEVLRQARPDDAYEGEELGGSGNTASGRTWLIDPICGTANFAARTPLMVVNVALRERGEVAVAAAADPLAGEVFWTDGRVAQVRRGGTDRPLAPSAASGLVGLDLTDSEADRRRLHTARLLMDSAFMAAFRPRILSTSLTLPWVAAGRHAAYLTAVDGIDSVHFAGGIALCRAAGCLVTGVRGEPLHSGSGGLIAAADSDTHARLLAIVERLTGARAAAPR